MTKKYRRATPEEIATNVANRERLVAAVKRDIAGEPLSDEDQKELAACQARVKIWDAERGFEYDWEKVQQEILKDDLAASYYADPRLNDDTLFP